MATGTILTNAGRNLLAKALAGKQLLFTKAAVGNGDIGTRDAKTLTGLISYKRDLPIRSITTTSMIGTVEVVLEMTNENLTQGFFLKEYGLFAKDPDTQTDILYAYRSFGDKADYLEADNGADRITYTLSLITVIDRVKDISAVITSTTQYATISRLEQRVRDIYAPYANIAGFWTFTDNDAERIRPATLAQTRSALWGNLDLPSMQGRISRLEDALSQLILNVEILQGHDDTYSHYMAEDFSDTSTLDMFSAQCVRALSGSDELEIYPTAGIIPGSSYTLSDGLRAETIRVESIILESGIEHLRLSGRIVNSYTQSEAKIFRTNTLIENREACGVGARLRKAWEPGTTWKGTAASEAFSVNVDLSLGNSRAFIFSGDATLNSSGLVTLTI